MTEKRTQPKTDIWIFCHVCSPVSYEVFAFTIHEQRYDIQANGIRCSCLDDQTRLRLEDKEDSDYINATMVEVGHVHSHFPFDLC